MSGCAHARMGILGPHPSPECEDARPSLPALRSGWAILILRGRDHGLITTPNHTTTSWRVNRAILHILFTPRGPRARGCETRDRRQSLYCVSRFTVNKKAQTVPRFGCSLLLCVSFHKKTSEFTHYSFVGKRRARGSFRRSGALRGLRFSCTPALAAGACNTSDFPSVHITYAISIIVWSLILL